MKSILLCLVAVATVAAYGFNEAAPAPVAYGAPVAQVPVAYQNGPNFFDHRRQWDSDSSSDSDDSDDSDERRHHGHNHNHHGGQNYGYPSYQPSYYGFSQSQDAISNPFYSPKNERRHHRKHRHGRHNRHSHSSSDDDGS